MKKYLIFAAAALMTLSACTDETYVDRSVVDKQNQPVPMGFNVHVKNQTRATVTNNLQNTKVEFGVWTYKKKDSADPEVVMDNYLVGYHDPLGKVGGEETALKTYYTTSTINPTLGASDQDDDKKSYWFYQGLGNSQYSTLTGVDTDKFIDPAGFDKSFNAEQFIKYWDDAADSYSFFAYIPYSKTASITGGVISFPEFSGAMSTTDAAQENMVATKSYTTKPFTHNDVPLAFKRLNGKVRVAFYEDIAGYYVQLTGTYVTAAPKDPVTPATDPVTYNDGKIAVTATPKYNVTTGAAAWVYDDPDAYSSTALEFTTPTGVATSIKGTDYNVIAESKTNCLDRDTYKSMSADEYYCVPANTETGKENSGLLFTFSFKTIATDTGEVTEHKDVTVYVGPEYTKWVGNTMYTYIFRITSSKQNPIVFDGIVISDYSSEDVETDFLVD